MPDFLPVARAQLAQYRAYFGDSAELTQIESWLATKSSWESAIARASLDAHATASAAILDPAGGSLLLIHHKKLDLWLQPGGHIDSTDADWLAAAAREAREETGLRSIRLHPWHAERPFPIHLDPHRFPENLSKHEPEHWHFDARFLFVADPAESIRLQASEVAGSRWMPIAEAPAAVAGLAARIRSELGFG